MHKLLGAVWLAACQTTSGIPCFTLGYEHSVWALVKSPARDLITSEVTGTMAVRQDGSFAHAIQPGSRFAVRDRQTAAGPSIRIHLAAENRLIVSNKLTSGYDFRHPSLFFADGVYRRAKDGDANCRATIAGFGKTAEPTGTATMLGEPVVTWKFQTSYGDATASVAPGLDCQVLRFEAIEYRYHYLPVRKELFEAKTLRRGEPAAALFTPPGGK